MRHRTRLRQREAAVARCLQRLWGFGQMCLPRGPKASCQAECPHKVRTITAAHLFGRGTKEADCCERKGKSAISFQASWEPQELGAALARSSRNCIGNFSMWM